MSQTKEGAAKAKSVMIEKYGPDFWKRIGSTGGKKSGTGGFYYAKKNYTPDDPRHPANAGKRGGKLSVRKAKATV
jgi:general stress protein YciG